VLEIGRERRADVDLGTRERVRECQSRGVEKLALEPKLSGPAVQRVAGDGQVDRREVDADLMRAPRLERHAEQRVARHQLGDLEVRHCVARRVRVERMAERIVAITADRRLDRPAPRAWPADDESQVLARQAAGLHELLQPPVRLARPCDDEQPRGVAVEPVHDSGPLRLVAALHLPREQPVHERALAVPGCRMHDDARRLVDHEQVLVFVRNRELHRLRRERRHGGRRRLELELLAAGEPRALGAYLAVDEHAAVAKHSFGRRPRPDLGDTREEPVEPLAGGAVRNAQARHAVAAAGRRRAACRRARRRRSR